MNMNHSYSGDKTSTYTFVFNSTQGVKSGLSANEVKYNIDWSILPDQPYYIHFTYLGEVNNIDNSTLPLVYIDLGTPTNVFEAGSPVLRTQAGTSLYIGFCKMYLLGASSFLHAEDGTNAAICIKGRPRNNTPTIQIFNNSNPRALYAPASGNLGDYVINLHFIPAIASSDI